jgi:hypothetical protein
LTLRAEMERTGGQIQNPEPNHCDLAALLPTCYCLIPALWIDTDWQD